MRTLETVVVESPVFATMTPGELELLAGCARNTRFLDGEYLFQEGGRADVFYLVRHGSVALELHAAGRGQLTIETVEAGELVGWSWLFPPYRWHFDARAVGLVRAVSFDGTCLRTKCEEDHSFGYQLYSRFSQVLVDRLQATRLQLLDLYGSGTRT